MATMFPLHGARVALLSFLLSSSSSPSSSSSSSSFPFFSTSDHFPSLRHRCNNLSLATPAAPFRPLHFSLHSSPSPPPSISPSPSSLSSSSSSSADVGDGVSKPPFCTADELHHVPVPGTLWRLALWRYTPSLEAPKRNHPLVLLSGVGTNAVGFDLSPGASFARYMSNQGFDTWIVEVRGAGLSTCSDSKVAEQPANDCKSSESIGSVKGVETISILPGSETCIVNNNLPPETSEINESEEDSMASRDKSQIVTRLTDTLMLTTRRLSEYFSGNELKVTSANLFNPISNLFDEAGLSERFNEIYGRIIDFVEERQDSVAYSQISDLIDIIYEGRQSVFLQLFNLQERLAATIENFQKPLDPHVKYDWDFDHYLEEDIPAAMEYIRIQTQPEDGKLLAIGHSMGGILLYAMMSRCGFEQRESNLAAVVSLASSLDYTPSESSLKLLLPLADPAQALQVPSAVPLGALLTVAHAFATRLPDTLSWFNAQISAQDMMHPELFEKLVLNNFCTIPAKLLLQLTTAFHDGGLQNRSGTFFYKDHLHKSDVPVLALAGDQDLICPPEAVFETIKVLPQHIVTYRLLGRPEGPHYGHYDLVGCRLASEEVYPCIIEFLSKHDSICK